MKLLNTTIFVLCVGFAMQSMAQDDTLDKDYATPPYNAVRLHLMGTTSFAGPLAIERTGTDTFKVQGDYKAGPTTGLALGIEIPLIRYLSVGGRFGGTFWWPNAYEALSFRTNSALHLLNTGIQIKPKLPIEVGYGYLELYALIDGGFIFNVDLESDKALVRARNYAGLYLGTEYFLTNHWGFFVEVGGVYRQVFDKAADPLNMPTKVADLTGGEATMVQVGLNLGVTLAF